MKALTGSLAALLFVGGLCSEVDAQRRNRGSVRYARPDGNYNRSTRRGGNVQSTQTTQGDRRTTQSTGTTRGGETVSSTREVTRDGDTLKLEAQGSSSTGASREVEKEVQFDDGRVDQVERQSTTTGRGGETIDREAKAEREGYGVASFEGEAKTSTGREAEVEGVAGYGAYGRRGVVADVDTKYHGDWTTVAGRGRYGAAVTRLPQGYRPYTYYGRSYYYYGSAYYRPYYYGGVPYYWVMPPPYGVVYTTVPVGAAVVVVAGASYYYADHVCYKQTGTQGSVAYEVVPAPPGIETQSLPPERATVTVAGTTYYFYKNTFYRQVVREGQKQYVVVQKPAGVTSLAALPAEFEIEQMAAGASYFRFDDTYYLPYVEGGGDEVYIVVDPPAPAATVRTASADGTEVAERSLTVAPGEEIPVRFTTELSSATTQKGARFTAYLDTELRVGQLLAVPKGAKIFGIVASLDRADSMSGQSKMTLRLTDIEVNGRVVPLVSSSHAVAGASESKDTAKKIAGGAALGAAIGAVADGGSGAAWGAAIGAGAGTAASAATSAKPAVVAAQSVVTFRLEQGLSVPIAVRVTETAADGP